MKTGKMLRRLELTIGLILFIAFGATRMEAGSIAVNFSDDNDIDTVMSVSYVAGVAVQSHWNDSGQQVNGNLDELVDDAGRNM